MCTQRTAIIITAGIGMVAVFFPWYKLSPHLGYVSGVASEGFIPFCLFGIILFIGIVGDRRKPIAWPGILGLLIPALLVCIYGIWKMTTILQMSGQFYEGLIVDIARLSGPSMESGLPLIVIAGFLTIIFSVFNVFMKDDKTEDEKKLP